MNKHHIYRYYVPAWGETDDDATPFSSVFDLDSIEYLAEDAAEHIWNERDGWEASWPMTLVLLDTDGRDLGKFSVDTEARPTFHATATP